MITLRPSCTEDDAFQYQLYVSTRVQEMTQFGWDAAQVNAFLLMQFRAQTQSYRMQFPDAMTQIVLQDETAIGRLVTHRTEREIHLVDIALLPDYHNQGIGTRLIQELLEEAAQAGKTVLLYVQAANPASRLYKRLGFVDEGEEDLYQAMRWQPTKKLDSDELH